MAREDVVVRRIIKRIREDLDMLDDDEREWVLREVRDWAEETLINLPQPEDRP